MRLDPDPAVLDLEAQPLQTMRTARLHAHSHPPRGRKLDRVRQQVAQHLAQATHTAAIGVGQVRRKLGLQHQPFLARARVEQQQLPMHHLAQREAQRFRQVGPFLEACVVEDLIQGGQQGLARLVQHLQTSNVFGRERALSQELDHAQHAVHRRADLVAHGGKELRLGPICRLGGFLGRAQAARALVDLVLELIAAEGKLLMGTLTTIDILLDRHPHVVERGNHRIQLVGRYAGRPRQAQWRIKLPLAQLAGIARHALEVAGDEPLEDHHQHPGNHQDGQRLAEEDRNPTPRQAPQHRIEVDLDHEPAELAQTLGRRIAQHEDLIARSPRCTRWPQPHLHGGGSAHAFKTHCADVGKIQDALHLQTQLLVIDVPQAAPKAGQVAATDELEALVDEAHLAAVLDAQLQRGRQQGKAQAAGEHIDRQAMGERMFLAVAGQPPQGTFNPAFH